MPNQNGNVYGLTILSPIINTPDGDVSHDCAIRDYLALLPRDHRSPFAKISSTHLARLVVMDDVVFVGTPAREEHLKSKYLVFETNFDGDLDAYLAVWRATPPDEVRRRLAALRRLSRHSGPCRFRRLHEEVPARNHLLLRGRQQQDRAADSPRPARCKPEWPISSSPTRENPPPKSRWHSASSWTRCATRPNRWPASTKAARIRPPAAREPWSELNPSPANTKDNQMVNLNVADIQGFVLRGYNFPFARYLLLELVAALKPARDFIGRSSPISPPASAGTASRSPPSTSPSPTKASRGSDCPTPLCSVSRWSSSRA